VKFVCENCKTKYSIADQKVRRKVLKIRCKNCANIIVVRDPTRGHDVRGPDALRPGPKTAAPASALDQAFDGAFAPSSPVRQVGGAPGQGLQAVARAAQVGDESFEEMQTVYDDVPGRSGATPLPKDLPKDEGEEWYLAVDEHQFGPMSFNELAKRVKRGEAHGDEAFVWRDGFDEWVEVAKVPELRPYAPPPAPPSRSGLYSAVNLQNMVDPPGVTPPGVPVGVPPGVPLGVPPGVPPGPPGVFPPAVATPMRAPTITPAPVVAPPIGPVTQEPALPLQPELRASALESGLRYLPAAYGDRLDTTLPPQLAPAPPPKEKVSGWFKLTAVAAMGTLLIGFVLLVYFLFFDRPPRQQVALGTATHLPASTIQPGRTLASKIEDPKTVVFKPVEIRRDEHVPTKHSSKRSTPQVTPEAQKPAKKVTAAERRQRELLKAMGGDVSGTVPSAPRVRRRRAVKGRNITGGEIQTLQKRHGAMLKACYTRASKRDNTLKNVKAIVNLTVGSSGAVTAVKVTNMSDYSMRICLERSLRRWVFRPIGGNQKVDVSFPLLFRAN